MPALTLPVPAVDLRICHRRRSVIAGEREVELPDLSFRLLALLADRAPEDVTYAEIEREVWRAQVTRETMKQRVTLVRESLRTIGVEKPGIEAVRNVGYRTTLRIGEARSRRRGGIVLLIALTAGLCAAAVAGAFGYARWRSEQPMTIAVESAEAPRGADRNVWDAARRMLVRDLSKIDGVRVIDASGPSRVTPDLVARLALDPGPAGMLLSTQLVDRRSGSVLYAERYGFEPQAPGRAIQHFANNAHGALTGLALDLGRQGYTRQSGAARTAYLQAYGLWRRGDLASLRAAEAKLADASVGADNFPLAKSLRARIRADLVLRGADVRLAAEAERDASALVEENPAVGDYRYSLARAKLALGDEAGALEQLRQAARTLPFLDRDVRALERQIVARSVTTASGDSTSPQPRHP